MRTSTLSRSEEVTGTPGLEGQSQFPSLVLSFVGQRQYQSALFARDVRTAMHTYIHTSRLRGWRGVAGGAPKYTLISEYFGGPG